MPTMSIVLGPVRVWLGGAEMEVVDAPGLTITRTDFDNEVAVRRDDGDADYDGWYCIATNPWPCPAEGCGFVAHHMTAAHLVVVWPSLDDSALLGQAQSAKQLGRNPRILEYNPELGPCIPWDEWQRLGRPIHSRIERPADWNQEAWRI